MRSKELDKKSEDRDKLLIAKNLEAVRGIRYGNVQTKQQAAQTTGGFSQEPRSLWSGCICTDPC